MARRRTGGPSAQHTELTSSALDDGALLARSRSDAEAFGAFYDRHHRAVLRYFQYHTGSGHLAAELTAETFAEALAGLHRYDPGKGSAVSWLFGIAAHQFHGFLRDGAVDERHRVRLRIVTPTSAVDEVERAVELADAHRLRPELRDALAGLSAALREAVLLRVGDDLPYTEVAERLGCTEGTARVRVARGLRQLNASMVAS